MPRTRKTAEEKAAEDKAAEEADARKTASGRRRRSEEEPGHGEAPGRLQYAQDGRIVTPPEFGGPGGPAEEGAVELFVHDPSRAVAPRQEVQQEEIASAHPDLGPDAVLTAEEVEEAESDESEEG